MPKKIAPVPKGYRTVTPSMVIHNADAAMAFYAEVFGAEVLSRVYADDGITVLNAEMKIGNSLIIVSDEMPLFGIYSPLSYGGTSMSQHLYLPNVDDVWRAAVDAGCGVLVGLADMPYGERFGKLIDPFGHVWSMSKRIAKVAPQEIKAKADAEDLVVHFAEDTVVEEQAAARDTAAA